MDALLRLLRWSAGQEVHAERVSTDQISSYCYPAQLGKPSMPAACFKHLPRRAQVKAEIQEVVQFLRNPRRFLDLGARSPAGILLVGPPGTGAPLRASSARQHEHLHAGMSPRERAERNLIAIQQMLSSCLAVRSKGRANR